MTTNSTQEAEGRVQALGASVQDGQRRLEIIRRVEAGEHQEPGTIAFYKQYGPLLVSLHEDGALWLMDSVEATRAFREAQTFTAAEMRALYGFFWSIALVEVCDIALALGDDRTPEQVAPESAIGEATPEQWERYNQAYLKERYAWAERLLCIVVEYGHELEPHIDPTLRPVWDAALKRAWPEDGPGDRAGMLDALAVHSETPAICPGLATMLRRAILAYDREV